MIVYVLENNIIISVAEGRINMMSLEEYIVKRKKQDKVNEFDITKKTKNMARCVRYVLDYFEQDIDPKKNDLELAKRKSIIAKSQVLKEYDPEVGKWVVDIYEEYGVRLDWAASKIIKNDHLCLLWYRVEDMRSCVEQFINKNKTKVNPLIEQEKQVMMLFRELIKKELLNVDRPSADLGKYLLDWVDSTLSKYGVNIEWFAFKMALEVYYSGLKYEYDLFFQESVRVKEYDVTKEKENLFDIDNLYEQVRHYPFFEGKKTELEMLMVHSKLDLKENAEHKAFWDKYAKEKLGDLWEETNG